MHENIRILRYKNKLYINMLQKCMARCFEFKDVFVAVVVQIDIIELIKEIKNQSLTSKC